VIKKQGNSSPDADTLWRQEQFQLIRELDFSEIIPFVRDQFRSKGWFKSLYLYINIGNLVILIGYSIWTLSWGNLSVLAYFIQIFTGIIAGSILVILPHELLHGLAYRFLGARQIRIGADLQQFVFYVSAHRFPISGKSLIILALTPFMVINLLAILLASLLSTQIWAAVLTFLLCHNLMCIGDFAMAQFSLQKGKGIYTFDDLEEKKSYFFQKRSSES